MVDVAATRIEAQIPGARRGPPKKLKDCEARYVHFQDAHLPQPMAVWLYATREGAAYNVPGAKDVIGVGLKHDTDEELDRPTWKFRRLRLFTWREHIDARHGEGFRWLCSPSELSEDPQAASGEVAERVLAALRRAHAIPEAL